MSKRFDNALIGLRETYPSPDPRRREDFLSSLPVQEKRRTAVIPFLPGTGKPIWYAIPAVAVAAVMLTVGIRTYRQNPPHQIPVVETTTTSYTETMTQQTLTETVTQAVTETTRQTTQHTTKPAPTTETAFAERITTVPASTKPTTAATGANTTAKPATQAAQSPTPAHTTAATRPTDAQESMTHKPASQTAKPATETTRTTFHDPEPSHPINPAETPTEPAIESTKQTSHTTRQTTTTTRRTTAATSQTTATTRRTTAATSQTTATTRRTTATTHRTTEPTTIRTTVRTTITRATTRMTTVTTARTTTRTTTRTTARTTQTRMTTEPTIAWQFTTTTPPETRPIYTTQPTMTAWVPEQTAKPTEASFDPATPAESTVTKWTDATEPNTEPQQTKSHNENSTYTTAAIDPQYSKDENAPVWTDFEFDFEPSSELVPIWGNQAYRATQIVTGIIVNIRYTNIDGYPYTAMDVAVQNVVSGSRNGGTLTVLEPGGYMPLEELAKYHDSIRERMERMTDAEREQAATVYEDSTSLPEPVIGEECMFFLMEDWNTDGYIYSGSPHFCRLRTVDGIEYSSPDYQMFRTYNGRFRVTPTRIRNFLATGE